MKLLSNIHASRIYPSSIKTKIKKILIEERITTNNKEKLTKILKDNDNTKVIKLLEESYLVESLISNILGELLYQYIKDKHNLHKDTIKGD